MQHQDWDTVVFKKKNTVNNSNPKIGEKKNIKNTLIKNDLNMRKLDEENEKLAHDTVSFELKIAILKARNAKKLSQKDLAKEINVKQDIIASYENGTAIPNNTIINKLQKVLGAKLTGLNKKN
tara:strand:+ start:153 stop:521 length:369 start_codon:yes stop_codon:yes gene_type:complete